MSRPKAFDPDRAMKEAMEAFWERGYAGTSVNDLLAEMNLNRGSLYSTFGDKKSLFLAALNEYDRQLVKEVRKILDRPVPAKRALRDWVAAVGETCHGDTGRRACLICKAAMELSAHDKDVAEWLRRTARRNERLVAQVVRRGQQEGDVNSSLDPQTAARFLLVAMAGLRQMGTTSPSAADVAGVIEVVLKSLD